MIFLGKNLATNLFSKKAVQTPPSSFRVFGVVRRATSSSVLTNTLYYMLYIYDLLYALSEPH